MPRRPGSYTRACVTAVILLISLLPIASPRASAASDRQTGGDWTMYHADPARSGYVAGVPDPAHLTTAWTTALDGAVYAEPLVVGGNVLVVTEHDSFYSLDAQTGKVVWRVTVGTPVPESGLPCGDIFPLGITGTPVYDPRTGLIFAVAEVTGPAHILFGIDAKTGRVKVRRSVDAAGTDPAPMQERGALALAGNTVYVAYGGLTGDCGDYHGTVVGTRTDGTGALLSYRVPTPREGGIWSTPGPVMDSKGNLYVSVGNGSVTQGNWDRTDSILRLSPTLQLEDAFAPATWQHDNASDADLGSMGPVLLPNGLLYANGKSGHGYLLHADHLGGIGGQIQTITTCGSYGGSAVQGQSLYIPCADRVRQLKVTAGPRLVVGWLAPNAVTGSPVIGGQTVYTLNPGAGTLYALNAATGAVRATVAVGVSSRFATPSISGTTLFVGTMQGITAVRIG